MTLHFISLFSPNGIILFALLFILPCLYHFIDSSLYQFILPWQHHFICSYLYSSLSVSFFFCSSLYSSLSVSFYRFIPFSIYSPLTILSCLLFILFFPVCVILSTLPFIILFSPSMYHLISCSIYPELIFSLLMILTGIVTWYW